MSSSSRQESSIAKGDQNPHFSPTWNFSTGGGLDRAHLDPWKKQLARIVLISKLAEQDAFWHHVDQVRGGEDPLEVAAKAKYGYGKRPRPIADLLAQAASEASGGVSSPGANLTDEERTRVRASLENCAHWTVGDEPPGRGPYAHRPDFLQAILDGADLIARRGAGKCLVREGPRWCSQTAQPSVGRDGRAYDGAWYCRRHSSGDEYEHGRRDKRMALVLRHVAAAMR